MKRDSFVFYRSFMEAIEQLDESQHLEVLRAIIGYALEGTMPEKKGVASAILMSVKPVIDKNNTSYENGKRGGRPKTQPKPNHNPTVTEQKPNNNPTVTEPKPYVDVDVDVNADADEEGQKTGARAPTVEEIRSYAASIGYSSLDAQGFMDYYTARGWIVSGESVKDWQALVRRWQAREAKKPAEAKPNKFHNFSQRTEDLDAEMFARIKKQQGRESIGGR